MLRFRSFSLMLAAVLAAVSLGACSHQPATLPDNRAADAAAVEKADADWSAAAQSKQADAWLAFYADDAVVLPPNEAMATSKDEIRKSITDLLALPGLSVSWQTTKAEAARSDDLCIYLRHLRTRRRTMPEQHGRRPTIRKIFRGLEETGRRGLEMHCRYVELGFARWRHYRLKTKHHAAKHSKRRHHAN